MTKTNEQKTDPSARPVVVSRTFPAPRDLVFRAWSSADHLKRWFCPAGFTVPHAKVEFRVGGAFNICMRSPQGQESWTNGTYTEIVPNTKLAIDMHVVGDNTHPLFNALTIVTFADDHGATRMEVAQYYTIFDPSAERMIEGASLGWSQTLDRLEQEVAAIKLAEPVIRSVVHATFRIERTYDAPRELVFRALTDKTAKAQWFSGGAGFTLLAREMDARPGGSEHLKGRWDSGIVTTFDAHYHDVIPNERVVFSYQMHIDERKISVSLATFELRQAGAKTQLVLTEQGAFFDGYDDAGSREHGTQSLLDALGKFLER